MPSGTALWAPCSGKSWAPTPTGCPARCHSCPAAAYSPSTSFFLVSTLITGCPAAVNSLTRPLLYRNCASRSGCRAPGGPRGPLQGEPLGLGAARPRYRRPPGALGGSARRPASGWTSPSSATGTPGPHADPARPAPAGPGPGPDRARAAACGPHPPPAPGRPAHRPTRAHRAPPSTPPPAQHARPGAHPHTPTPGQPLPTPGVAAAHPDGAAARRTPPRAPLRSVSSRRDPTAQPPHQTRKLLIGGSQGPGKVEICPVRTTDALAPVSGSRQLACGVARARQETNSDISLLCRGPGGRARPGAVA